MLIFKPPKLSRKFFEVFFSGRFRHPAPRAFVEDFQPTAPAVSAKAATGTSIKKKKPSRGPRSDFCGLKTKSVQHFNSSAYLSRLRCKGRSFSDSVQAIADSLQISF